MKLTRVSPLEIDDLAQHRLRFGLPCRQTIVTRRRRDPWFTPGARFGHARWRGNRHGKCLSRIIILAAAEPAAARIACAGVDSGGTLLLALSGSAVVSAAPAGFDQWGAFGLDPADVTPDHWRHVQGRLSAGFSSRPCPLDRHQAGHRQVELGLC